MSFDELIDLAKRAFLYALRREVLRNNF